MTDRIEKIVDLNASQARVWAAISDYREFGTWFQVRLDQPFKAGQISTGAIASPGYETFKWLARVEEVVPEKRLAFRWFHPDKGSTESNLDNPSTLVSFDLEPKGQGTRLTITESGFEALPDGLRAEVMRSNTEGWSIQGKQIAAYLDGQA